MVELSQHISSIFRQIQHIGLTLFIFSLAQSAEPTSDSKAGAQFNFNSTFQLRVSTSTILSGSSIPSSEFRQDVVLNSFFCLILIQFHGNNKFSEEQLTSLTQILILKTELQKIQTDSYPISTGSWEHTAHAHVNLHIHSIRKKRKVTHSKHSLFKILSSNDETRLSWTNRIFNTYILVWSFLVDLKKTTDTPAFLRSVWCGSSTWSQQRQQNYGLSTACQRLTQLTSSKITEFVQNCLQNFQCWSNHSKELPYGL